MKQEIKQQIGQSVQGFRLPRYQEIPDVGLYLEQATKYICRYLSPILETPLTASMISNYVKRGLLSSPVKKQYSRDQVAYLFFIAVAKNVLSLDALACFLRLQERTYPLEKAYDYFCRELENLLLFQFEVRETIESSDEDSSDEKRLLYSCTAAVVQKVYMEKWLEAVSRRMNGYRFFVSLSANSFPERLTFPVVCGIIGQLNQKTPDIREVFIHDAIQNP